VALDVSAVVVAAAAERMSVTAIHFAAHLGIRRVWPQDSAAHLARLARPQAVDDL
jgi:hypothetical protein